MDDERKTIRFIDSHYKTLFTIKDGESITITREDGEKITRSVKHLGETHIEISGNCYHICQFAEIMERQGSTYAPATPEPPQRKTPHKNRDTRRER